MNPLIVLFECACNGSNGGPNVFWNIFHVCINGNRAVWKDLFILHFILIRLFYEVTYLKIGYILYISIHQQIYQHLKLIFHIHISRTYIGF